RLLGAAEATRRPVRNHAPAARPRLASFVGGGDDCPAKFVRRRPSSERAVAPPTAATATSTVPLQQLQERAVEPGGYFFDRPYMPVIEALPSAWPLIMEP